jgi:signal peptidase I
MSTAPDRILNADELRDVGSQLLQDGHSVKMRLGGYSMWPFLLPGDVATIVSARIDTVELGDVLVMDRGDRWVAHRLISAYHKGDATILQTRGDSCLRNDALCPEELLIGRLVQIHRGPSVFSIDSPTSKRYAAFMVLTSGVSSPMLWLILQIWRLPFRAWRKIRSFVV